jgi:hypothetical protein
MSVPVWVKLYGVFLGLFPSGFRADFSEEMLEVFSLAIADTSLGRYERWRVFLREFASLPPAALKERMRKSESEGAPALARGWHGSLRGKELLVAMGAFVFPYIGVLLNADTHSLLGLAFPLALALMGLVLLFGLFKGIPRWCLPYLGLALSMLSFFIVFNWIIDKYVSHVIPLMGPGPVTPQTRLLWEAFFSGMLWFGLFLAVFLFLGVVAAVRRLRPFYLQLQQDWTAISFIFYIGAMTALVLLFQDYRYEGNYALSSIFFLAAGAWIYLRSPYSWQRALALLSGLTLAMWVAGAGTWVTVPGGNFTAIMHEQAVETEPWFKIGLTLMQLGWMLLFLLMPKYLRIFPFSRGIFSSGSFMR